MTEHTVVHSTFVINRHYPATPERVFGEMDFRVGGRERSRFSFEGGPAIVCDAVYQDIVPDKRIVFVYTMTADHKRMSSSLTTIELVPAEEGTDLLFTEQGAFFDGAGGSAAAPGWSVKEREHGSRGLLEQLAKELTNA